MSLTRMIGIAGPNVSSRTSSQAGSTWSTTVGGKSAPRRSLPCSSWGPGVAAPVVTVQQLGAVLGHRFAHPVLEQGGGAFVDHRADISLGIQRIAGLELLGLGQHPLDEGVGHALDHDDALHRGAALA